MDGTHVTYLAGRMNQDNEELEVSIETYICVFICMYCDLKSEVCFINVNCDYPCAFPVRILNNIKYQFYSSERTEEFSCALPAVEAGEETTVIAGLCAVLRWLIKAHVAIQPGHYSESLLGFRGGCLVSCVESSIWTRFCELQLPSSVREVFSTLKHENSYLKIPENLMLLEAHLKRPVRTHNILKRKLDIAKKVQQTNSKVVLNNTLNGSSSLPSEMDINFTLYDSDSIPVQTSDLQQKLKNMVISEKSHDFCFKHCYLEGIDLTLADMIVFPCVHYLLHHLPYEVRSHVNHIMDWYLRMCSNSFVQRATKQCAISLKFDKSNDFQNIPVIIPEVDQISLYKRDPSYSKVKCKHQNPEHILLLLKMAGIWPEYCSDCCTTLEWETLPSMLHPSNGDLPEKRLNRKCQQIESIVTAVLKFVQKGQTVVDFCAGGGHVGLLLAHFLPNCKVILVENKESSMMRAKLRAKALNLKNVTFYQCNLDYFKGKFDVGVSLHACGVATDLVIQQCLKEQASFVCCPCCYGGVQNTHLLNYPLSQKFHQSGLLYKDYILLAHCADRTEVNTPTSEEGEICMGLIDTDRAYYAEEHGYQVLLTTLQPITCSPKHNVLIGVSPLCRKQK